MATGNFEIIVIGGSSGSLPVLINIIDALPDDFEIPIIIIIHRLKNVKSDLKNLLSSKRKTFEPEEYRQRSLEGPEDGPLRGWLRDRKDVHEKWAWGRGVVWRVAVWFGGGATAIVTLKAAYDALIGGSA